MSRVSVEVPPHVFAEYERWGKETAGKGAAKPARAMMMLVLNEIAERRMRDRKAAAQPAPSPLLDAQGRSLRPAGAPTLLVPAQRATIVPLKRRSQAPPSAG